MFCYRFSPKQKRHSIHHVLYDTIHTHTLYMYIIWVRKQLLPYGYHIMFIRNRKYGFTLRIALFPLEASDVEYTNMKPKPPQKNIYEHLSEMSVFIQLQWKQIYKTVKQVPSMKIVQLIHCMTDRHTVSPASQNLLSYLFIFYLIFILSFY